MIRHAATLAALAALGLCLPGCEDDPPPAAPAPPRPALDPGAAGPNARTGPNARRPGQEDPPPPMQISDRSFVSDINQARDPFKSYFGTFVLTTTANIDQVRDVKLGRYSLDDLRLVAVIVGTDSPYAMVVDPSRAGTVLRRGMYVGRQEFVQTPQGGYNTHWRVARIEPGRYHRVPSGEFEEIAASLVFERSNPLDNTAQVVERSITLATGVAGAQQNQQSGGPMIGPIPGVGGPTPGYLPPNLGGVGGGSATGAILGTQAAVQQAVSGNSAPPPQTTVVVQVPPSQPSVQPAPPSNSPPPIQVYNGNNSTR